MGIVFHSPGCTSNCVSLGTNHCIYSSFGFGSRSTGFCPVESAVNVPIVICKNSDSVPLLRILISFVTAFPGSVSKKMLTGDSVMFNGVVGIGAIGCVADTVASSVSVRSENTVSCAYVLCVKKTQIENRIKHRVINCLTRKRMKLLYCITTEETTEKTKDWKIEYLKLPCTNDSNCVAIIRCRWCQT